ncbi:MAG: hypothetical protein R6U37_02720 [Dehalococcoidia bacterium]
MATITKLFKRPEDVEKAMSDLKGLGCEASIIERGGESDLDSLNLSEQALDFYKFGIAIGGKVIKAEVDDARADDAKRALLEAGFEELTEREPQWANSPKFGAGVKMSSTNPLDAQMSGDFRKY